MKRRSFTYILVAVAMMTMTGCDKWDCNGDLDGMWQLTEWRDKDDKVKATKKNMIFYSFQLKMASFRQKGTEVRTSMTASPEQIHIYNPFEYVGNGHDQLLEMSVLSQYGVPEDGIFHVQVLTGSAMVLKTNGQDVLTFRKY